MQLASAARSGCHGRIGGHVQRRAPGHHTAPHQRNTWQGPSAMRSAFSHRRASRLALKVVSSVFVHNSITLESRCAYLIGRHAQADAPSGMSRRFCFGAASATVLQVLSCTRITDSRSPQNVRNDQQLCGQLRIVALDGYVERRMLFRTLIPSTQSWIPELYENKTQPMPCTHATYACAAFFFPAKRAFFRFRARAISRHISGRKILLLHGLLPLG
jgi:hypothetical protein